MTEQYRQDLFLLQPIISKFYFSSLKNGSQSLGNWQMNVNNTKVYIISLKIKSLCILCPNPSKDTNGSSVT